MLSVDKHCDMLSTGVLSRVAAGFDGFKLFVQLFSALAGGAVVVRLQYKGSIPAQFVTLSNLLAVLITFTGVILVGDAFRSWHGYRKRLSEVAGKDPASGENIIPPPHWVSSVWPMIAVMLISCVLFWYFNPLRMS